MVRASLSTRVGLLAVLASSCSDRHVTVDGATWSDRGPGSELGPWSDLGPCPKTACPAPCTLVDCSRPLLDPDDYDSDGVKDTLDNCPQRPNINQQDTDGDGIGDTCDSCPTASNKTQLDNDGDNIGDVCDPDMDNDGIANAADNCPLVANPDQKKTLVSATAGDACNPDIDGDGVPNGLDNCPLVYNPAQKSTDPAAFGSACDDDKDKDSIPDSKDNCPLVANPDQKKTVAMATMGDACNPDIDGDGVGNAQDNCPTTSNVDQKDSDRDAKGDVCDSRFCFTIAGDAMNCLDPSSPMRVYTPGGLLQPGTAIILPLYVNRTNVEMSYKWLVTARPSGSGTVVLNGEATCGPSASYLCGYPPAQPATLLVDRPGEYQVKLVGDLTLPDPVNPSWNRSSTYVSTWTAGGAPACICTP